MSKRCHKCAFFMTWDSGYSNYTVLETYCHCLKKANPLFPVEESYSWKREGFNDEVECLMVAEQCDHFREPFGCGQMRLDVDREVKIQDWPDLVALARECFGEEISSHDSEAGK